MSNNYFRFKQFSVEQDQCAMKVSTDACILGAAASVPEHASKALDLGTGTGLLSLMLAQRYPGVRIDAIEVDAAACEQARKNIEASTFKDRVRVICYDARNYYPGERYDFVICNPPFFSGSLKGPVEARNRARHDDSLSQTDLAVLLRRMLTEHGTACFLWPATEHEVWEQTLADHALHLHSRLLVKDQSDKKIVRVISTAGITPNTGVEERTLVIKNADRSYTAAFSELLHPFYLYL